MLKPKPPTIASVCLPEYLYHTNPYQHQEIGFNRSRDAEVFSLFWEPGTGKSKVFVDTACDLFDRGKIDLALVFAPNGVHRQWIEDEFRVHATVPWAGAFYRAGTKNTAISNVLGSPRRRLPVVAVNTEGMSHASIVAAVTSMVAGRRVAACLDESHFIKTPGSRRTKAFHKLRPALAYRRIMTGTEIGTGYENLYAQYAFLDPAIIRCWTYTAFRSQYCVVTRMGEAEFPVIVGYRNIDELKQRIAPHTMIVEKLDCLDLPAFTDVVHRVDLTPEQRRVYNDLVDTFLAELASGTVVEAQLAITRLQKLAQVASGHVSLGHGKWEPIPAAPRLDLACEIIQEARGKVIVWAEWQPDILQLSAQLRRMGVTHVTYYGGNGTAQNTANLHAFRQDPRLKVFLATPASGGTGLTINEADTTLFYNIGTSFTSHKQARARNYRPGQTKPVTYHTILAQGTIDRKLQKNIDSMGTLVQAFRDPATFKQWLASPED